ncbi:hypothetical protein FDJ34_gp51 [Microbacterium phage Eleri]|uniref:Uncharacterized protein n=4 Tax=Elerivirus eleri TaxID=2560589 RepID=A0A6N0A7U0_9CAUD|nr:hypothetical protein FDJ34_gp51 [Microbacterium phage Eleri]AXH70604.1 hypothetical protein SEA_COLACORTA_51 [Microbacterium phage ColaCorta]AXH70729.1 hypothetical protein SEA_ANDROMEDAS_51 [Microbacterium phage Andromedas]QKO02679.1 hypothetical protein SEA_GLAMOUR_51 [Microbacterium phage Glamour]UDG79023.1 hypothetical protein SEA_SARATOS_51 [Microbacterium phage Saratos]AUX83389.1 hypothetical protein SEA_ELERI_51 [Microbacterium phage Eleri]
MPHTGLTSKEDSMNPTIRVGQKWIDVDVRNTDRGKTGKAKPKYREVEIIALPTLSSPGVMKVLRAPKAPHTIGKLKSFTKGKLIENYALVGGQ